MKLLDVVCVLFVLSFLNSTTGQNLKRPKRYTEEILNQIMERLGDLEDEAGSSKKVIQALKSTVNAIGVGSSVSESGVCGDDGWIEFTKSTCIKVTAESQKMDEAKTECRHQFNIGWKLVVSETDVDYPGLVNIDTEEKQAILLNLLSNLTGIPSVWINHGNHFTNWTSSSNIRTGCTQLVTNDAFGSRGAWIDVSCSSISCSFVCEKTAALPYPILVRRNANLQSELVNTQSELIDAKTDIAALKNLSHLHDLFLVKKGLRVSKSNREMKCGSEYFYCWEDHKCIPRELICNRKNDCLEGSDEANCTYYPTETKLIRQERDTQFTCNNGQAINYYNFCDGNNNCEDNSDELKCEFRGKTNTCSPGQFSCIWDGRCIDGSWRMDGVADCDDKSDEDNYIEMPKNLTDIVKACEETETTYFNNGWSIYNNHDYFLCNNNSSQWECIPNIFVCSSVNNCPNDKDEHGCTTTGSWDDFQFHCTNGERVLRKFRCDGKRDCEDGSDEINCYKLDSYDHSFKLFK